MTYNADKKNEHERKDIGALWIKNGKTGEFLSGTIEGVGKVVIFRNARKSKESQPDWRVFPQTDRPQSRPSENKDNGEIPF